MAAKTDVTEAELAVLQVLWDRSQATVRELTDRLYPGGGTAHYGTVQKLLQRLEGKRHVRRTGKGVPHVYTPVLARDDLVDLRLGNLVDKLCAGSLMPILTHLTRRRRLTAKERDELGAFLADLEAGAAQQHKTKTTRKQKGRSR